jgi:hypothetical protein
MRTPYQLKYCPLIWRAKRTTRRIQIGPDIRNNLEKSLNLEREREKR